MPAKYRVNIFINFFRKNVDEKVDKRKKSTLPSTFSGILLMKKLTHFSFLIRFAWLVLYNRTTNQVNEIWGSFLGDI